jgi:hypothetical protein
METQEVLVFEDRYQLSSALHPVGLQPLLRLVFEGAMVEMSQFRPIREEEVANEVGLDVPMQCSEAHGHFHQFCIGIRDGMAPALAPCRFSKRDLELPEISELSHEVTRSRCGWECPETQGPSELAVGEMERGNAKVHQYSLKYT